MGNCCSGGNESKKATAFEGSDGYQPDLLQDHLTDGIGDEQQQDALLQQQQQQQQQQSQQQQAQQQQQQQAAIDGQAQLKALREEQNRLEMIVQMAGRGMVSVRSTRGSTGYYDQGFAAALGQHLEQTTKFPDRLPIRLPTYSLPSTSGNNTAGGSTTTTSNNTNATGGGTASSSGTTTATTTDSSSGSGTSTSAKTSTNAVFQRLSQPQWDNIALGKKNDSTGMAGLRDGENPNTYMDHVAVSFLDSVVPKKERIFHGGNIGPMVENLL